MGAIDNRERNLVILSGFKNQEGPLYFKLEPPSSSGPKGSHLLWLRVLVQLVVFGQDMVCSFTLAEDCDGAGWGG